MHYDYKRGQKACVALPKEPKYPLSCGDFKDFYSAENPLGSCSCNEICIDRCMSTGKGRKVTG
jgi:hypothetical protein